LRVPEKEPHQMNPNPPVNAFFSEGEHVREIGFKLWRNGQTKNWTAEINGARYGALTVETIHELVDRALRDSEESLPQSDGTDNGQVTKSK
jgi:hypothetical protein